MLMHRMQLNRVRLPSMDNMYVIFIENCAHHDESSHLFGVI